MLRGTRLQGSVQTFSTLTVTGQGLFGDGSAAAPSVSFLNDPGSGWYLSSVGDVRYTSGGQDRFRFSPPDVILAANALLRWGSSGVSNTDTAAGRDAANLFGVRESLAVRGGIGAGARSVAGSTSITTNDFTILCSTATQTLTVLLPSVPAMNQVVNVKKVSADANRLFIDGNGNLIDTLPTQSTIAQTRPSFMLQFSSTADTGNKWNILSAA